MRKIKTSVFDKSTSHAVRFRYREMSFQSPTYMDQAVIESILRGLFLFFTSERRAVLRRHVARSSVIIFRDDGSDTFCFIWMVRFEIGSFFFIKRLVHWIVIVNVQLISFIQFYV